jgi:hypothetical protein
MGEHPLEGASRNALETPPDIERKVSREKQQRHV